MMFGKTLIQKSIAILSALAVMAVSSSVSLAAAGKDITAEITVTGQVTVNGNAASVSTTLGSGSTIVTAADSTATINVSKVGRLELAPDSSIVLKFSETSLIGILDAGKVRVTNISGVATTITTKDAAVIGDASQANSFSVEVECSHTHAETFAGLVTMRTGNTDKQVAAGTDSTVGDMAQTGCQPCKRPGGTPAPFPVAGLGIGAIVGILVGVIGATGAAVLLGGKKDTTIGGGTIVVSPTR